MALLTFEMTDLDGNKNIISDVLSYEIISSFDAACDGLRLNFKSDGLLNEQYSIIAKLENETVFEGLVDTQRETFDNSGYSTFIYARSMACVLVENEAKPYVLNSPSGRTVWDLFISSFGFSYGLGEIYSKNIYQISKGTTLFGAMDNFAYSVTGKHIRVDKNNTIVFLQSGDAKYISDNILSIKRVINRGNALSSIVYKLSNNEDYIYHRESEFMKKKKISSSSIKNLSTVKDWQRETTLESYMQSANENYLCYEITILGHKNIEIMDRLVVSTNQDFEVSGLVKDIKYSLNQNGERTYIELFVPVDLEEKTYVAK